MLIPRNSVLSPQSQSLEADSSVVERPVYIRNVGWFDSPSAYQSLLLVSGFWPPDIN